VAKQRSLRHGLALATVLASCLVSSGCLGIAPTGALPVPLLNSATVAPVIPPSGILFSNVHAPLTPQIDEPKATSKKGSVKTWYVREPFFLTSYAGGDVSIEAAAAEGGIKEVVHADYEILQVLGIFGSLRVTVYGN
jgi:hypothetical protein